MELIKTASVCLMEMRQDIISNCGVEDSLVFHPTQNYLKPRKVTGGRTERMKERCLHCLRKINRDLIENLPVKFKATVTKTWAF